MAKYKVYGYVDFPLDGSGEIEGETPEDALKALHSRLYATLGMKPSTECCGGLRIYMFVEDGYRYELDGGGNVIKEED